MDRDLYVFFSTPGASPDGLMSFRCVNKLVDTGILKKENWSCVTNNVNSLAKNYNDILYSDSVSGKILVLIHSDLIVDDLFLKEKLNERFDRSGNAALVGIAGGSRVFSGELNLELWHLMTAPGNHLGEVTNGDWKDCLSPVRTTRFGTQGKRALIVDGCFMAMDVDRVRAAGVRFDESSPSKYNFYDLIFSLRCHWAGLEIYVDPIHVVHKSVGLTKMTEDFALGNEYFKTNYLSKL